MPIRAVLLLLLLLSSSALASEGKWMPEQVLQLDPKALRAQGLQLPPSKLWDPKTGSGVLSAAVGLGGCSAGFISPTGLFITNHHCLFGILQQHATPERDLIKDGFLARTRGEELYGQAERLYVPRRFVDVTKEVWAAAPAGGDNLALYRALERRQKELEKACDKPPALRCEVRAYDDGRLFMQVETMELRDVRMVWAPPAAVGDFGGDIDNWMWPRHAGDFAIGRAYVAPDGSPRAYDPANVPYAPKQFLPLSPQGVKPGDFVAVLGYPGFTQRSIVSAELQERVERYYPALSKMMDAWISILEDVSKTDDASRIAVASTLKGIHNRAKNFEGQLEGVRKRGLLERRRAEEDAIVAWAAKSPRWKAALAAREELGRLVEQKLQTYERDLLLGTFRTGGTSGSKALWMAVDVIRIAREKQKPDLEREPDLVERELPKLYETLARQQKSLSPAAERRLIAWFVEQARALPKEQQLSGVEATFGSAAPAARIDQLLAGTKVTDLAERTKMLAETPEQLTARHDPLLELAASLADDYQRLREAEDRRKGALYRLRRVWLEAVTAHAGKPVAPDANGTLRISYGNVKGYSPKDGVSYLPQTTLRGLMAKETGQPPFAAPEELKVAAAHAGNSRWKDAALGDVPVDFLADLDTTGGNSGSPVIDARGRLVGVNFDRVWENVTNDFAYDPAIARNISADVRYLLWHLDEVAHAKELLSELGVK